MANYFDTGILLTAGFSLSSQAPLDGRSVVELLTDLDTHIAENRAYEGMCVYVKENKKNYIYNGTTWEEFVGGGSSEEQIKDWVSGSSYLEGDYIYHEGEIYRCLTSNSDVDFDEANWIQVTYGIDELSKEDVERLLGLTEEEIEAMADLILDTEVRIDKTYSSSKIYTDIQQCLEDSKTYTLEEIAKLNGSSYKVVTSTSEMTSESIIYLLASENTYDMYIVEEDGTTTKIGDMNIDLSDYYTKAEVDNDFLKKADADGKFATITTVDNKVDKDKIVTTLDDTVTDEQVASAKVVVDELNKKANNDEVVKKTDMSTTINYTSTNDTAPTSKAIYDNVIYGVEINQKTLDIYGTEILKYPIGRWIIVGNDIANKFTDLPIKITGFIDIASINPAKGNPWEDRYSYRTYYFKPYQKDDYIRKIESTTITGDLIDTGWQKVCTTKVADVSTTTITPVNSAITGTIEYTVKNGICYVSLFNVKSTTNNNGLSISTTMPKPAINSSSAIYKQLGGGNIGIVYINKNTTQLTANIYISDIIGDCSFSYPVAE